MVRPSGVVAHWRVLAVEVAVDELCISCGVSQREGGGDHGGQGEGWGPGGGEGHLEGRKQDFPQPP